MRVVVTGGSGFIGKRVVRELQGRGHVPIVIDTSYGADVAKLDLNLLERFGGRDAKAVIHLAGVLGTEELFEDADGAIDVNIKGTVNVLRMCEQLGMSYVGITMPQVWNNVYQATKNAAMQMALAWHQHFGVPVSHVRAFNVFGEFQKIGKPQKIIPTFVDRTLRGEAIPVWGDGEQYVDLIYVGDVARTLVDALRFGDASIFDAGTGVARTVNEVARMVAHVLTPDQGPNVVHLPMRKGEHGSGVSAVGQGWEVLGYRPQFHWADFERTVRAYKSAEVPVLR